MASTIIANVCDSFERARQSGDLFFFPSTVHHHQESGLEFEIRLCPALQKKPILPTPHFNPQDVSLGVDQRKPDPFCPPYNPALLVSELRDEDSDDEFVILLNKFSVVPRHFLLVTKEYKSQATPLFPSELVQSYLLLEAARRAGENFFAFYNCGDRSGASQHHKHIQFLPVEDDGPPIEKLARTVHLLSEDKAFVLHSLPYSTHVRRLPTFSSSTPRTELEDRLGQAFMTLLDQVISTVRHTPDHPPGLPSYNVILTLRHLYLVPRRQEEHELSETGDKLSVNALGFAGMLLVKSEKELEAVKKEGCANILLNVGLANVSELEEGDAHEMDRL